MKRCLLAVLVILVAIGLCIPAFPEGTKILKLADNYSITVPEQAPDFTTFQGGLLGAEKYPNGNMLAIMGMANEDDTVRVAVLFVKIDEKFHCVAILVGYMKYERVEIYEDPGFAKTGQPSGKLLRVSQPTDINVFREHVSKVKI